ncbi:hypothetical protein [Jejuia spongiicola]|nr:hypothetical protein [Jejuia spongiicola]
MNVLTIYPNLLGVIWKEGDKEFGIYGDMALNITLEDNTKQAL